MLSLLTTIQTNPVLGAFDIGTLLQNATKTAKTWGGYLIVLAGVVLIIYAAVKIVSGLMSHGKQQISWPIVIVALLVGGAFSIGGLNFVSGIAEGGKKTIEDLGNGVGGIIQVHTNANQVSDAYQQFVK